MHSGETPVVVQGWLVVEPREGEGEGCLERERGSKGQKWIAQGCFKNKNKVGPTQKCSSSFETERFASRTSVNASYVSRTPNEANE